MAAAPGKVAKAVAELREPVVVPAVVPAVVPVVVPGAAFLLALVDVGIATRSATDALVHAHSFHARTVVLDALPAVAAAAVAVRYASTVAGDGYESIDRVGREGREAREGRVMVLHCEGQKDQTWSVQATGR